MKKPFIRAHLITTVKLTLIYVHFICFFPETITIFDISHTKFLLAVINDHSSHLPASCGPKSASPGRLILVAMILLHKIKFRPVQVYFSAKC